RSARGGRRSRSTPRTSTSWCRGRRRARPGRAASGPAAPPVSAGPRRRRKGEITTSYISSNLDRNDPWIPVGRPRLQVTRPVRPVDLARDTLREDGYVPLLPARGVVPLDFPTAGAVLPVERVPPVHGLPAGERVVADPALDGDRPFQARQDS